MVAQSEIAIMFLPLSAVLKLARAPYTLPPPPKVDNEAKTVRPPR